MSKKKGFCAVLFGMLVLGLTGCGNKVESEAPVVEETEKSSLETTKTVEKVEDILETLESEELDAMGLVQYETIDDLNTAMGREVVTLDQVPSEILQDSYELEEIAQEFGNATLRYFSKTEDTEKVIIIRSGSTEDMQVFLTGKNAEADVVVGDSVIVSMSKDDSTASIIGWWSVNDMSYEVEMSNLSLEEFSDLVMELASQTV